MDDRYQALPTTRRNFPPNGELSHASALKKRIKAKTSSIDLLELLDDSVKEDAADSDCHKDAKELETEKCCQGNGDEDDASRLSQTRNKHVQTSGKIDRQCTEIASTIDGEGLKGWEGRK